MKLYFLLILRCLGVNSTGLVQQPRKLEYGNIVKQNQTIEAVWAVLLE